MREKQEVVREAVLSAGSIVKDAFLQPPGNDETIEKGENDFVTRVDVQSERMIIDILKESFPEIGILAEEGRGRPGSGTFWIIDPLDGTTNFMHRFPVIGISVALYSMGEVVLGTIYDPLRGELFEALRDQGAYLNGERISVSSTHALPASLLGTGFPFRVRDYLDQYIKLFKLLFKQCRGIRRAGAAVIDLAYVASGRLDGFFELYLKPWDMAAGLSLIHI